MNIVKQDLFAPGISDVIAVTTNGVIQNGALVMGKGAALDAKRRNPFLPRIAGEKIMKDGIYIGKDIYIYHWLPVTENYALFQVKGHWENKADLQLISDSAISMRNWIEFTGRNVRMNFPGIGAGGLDRDTVEQRLWLILKDYPVTLCVM